LHETSELTVASIAEEGAQTRKARRRRLAVDLEGDAMHTHDPIHGHEMDSWRHEHVFLGATHRAHERRTWIVIALTAAMMVAEIAAGSLFGSMALLADGWHMATHAGALTISALAYGLARKHAKRGGYSFGTGKVGDLAGFTSAVVLALIALLIGGESLQRVLSPVAISFDEALAVAVLGLIVNLVSAWLLRGESHEHGNEGEHHHDQNLRAARLHVVADALTSVFAIAALSLGKWLGWVRMDPLMGVVGALVIARWSWGLLRDTSRTLLDREPDQSLLHEIHRRIEGDADNRVADLHLWRLGPGHLGVIVSLVTDSPRAPAHYKSLLAGLSALAHVTVEVNPCLDEPAHESAAVTG
jgi:cation diffusion facilitator family transporter